MYQNPKNATFRGTVVDTRMQMLVVLDDGKKVKLSGALPAGSLIDLHATGVLADGTLLGYEGYETVERAKRGKSLADKADAATARASTLS